MSESAIYESAQNLEPSPLQKQTLKYRQGESNDENRENSADVDEHSEPNIRPQSMREMSISDDEDEPVLKFVLMGDNSTGKTNLAFRFARNKFNPASSHTVGFEFQSKKMKVTNSLTIKAQLWDTAGQERYHSLTSAYLRNAVGILLVYDVTSRKSFEALNDWVKKIDENAHPNAVRALVGNKTDKGEDREVTTLEVSDQK